MNKNKVIENKLKKNKKKWLITGVAGFIGSNLLDYLLSLDQKVIGLDNFSLGYKKNLDEVKSNCNKSQWDNFEFIEGDICDFNLCQEICEDVDYVLHQAALGSVPRSIEAPQNTHQSNVNGFLNMLMASKESKVKGFVYAASSSTYGDHPGLPKVEHKIGNPLSPYAVSKYVNELYADVFATCYNFPSIGLRYFNVFGPRQDPTGAYAAVIPLWISSLINNNELYINGDGETSRDFCYIDNVIQANMLAATFNDNTINEDDSHNAKLHEVFNIAYGERTTLNELFNNLKNILIKKNIDMKNIKPIYKDYREGDVRHSLADISKARDFLGYIPQYSAKEGLMKAMSWYMNNPK